LDNCSFSVDKHCTTFDIKSTDQCSQVSDSDERRADICQEDGGKSATTADGTRHE